MLEIDHDFCISIYIRDPSGNMVEFCHTTRPFTDEELSTAEQVVRDPNPAMNGHAKSIVHDPILAEASAS